MLNLTSITELRKGNPTAYKELFNVLYPRLKVYCSFFISDKSLVEDVIQESFIALWEKRDTIRPEKVGFDMDNLQVNELQYLYQLDFTGKEGKSMEEELIESIKTAVDNLPPKMKHVFTRCKIEGLKQTEVAHELGISLKMVEKQIFKAKKRIRGKLLEQYPALLVLIALLLE